MRAATLTRNIGHAFGENRLTLVAVVILLLLLVCAAFGDALAPYDPLMTDGGAKMMPPNAAHVFGTDALGRDILSRVVVAARLDLGMAISAVALSFAGGLALGAIAGYFGGKVDSLIMRLVDLLLAFPSILVAMMLLAFLGKSVTNVVLTLVLIEWAYYARTARAQALVEARREYVEAARSLAIPNWRIVLVHILPNCLPPLIVVGMLQVARAITLEATLSFLGLGVPITEPSLGLLIANGYQTMLSGEYWTSVYPGLALLAMLVSINMVGDRLRELLNPRFVK